MAFHPSQVGSHFSACRLLVFASLGFANDSIDMRRQPLLRFAISVFLYGLFPVGYTGAGVTLRSKAWKAFLPLFVFQFLCRGLLGHWLPDGPQHVQLSARGTARLNNRLAFEGIATIVTVV